MKLFVQQAQDKFINNISLIEDKNLLVANDHLDGNLYQIHYRYNFDTYIFVSSQMSHEIYQYIVEFKNTHKIIIYHDIINKDLINDLKNYCINIGFIQNDDVIQIPSLINNHIFFNMHKSRNSYISCFIDNTTILEDNIQSVLYPQQKFNIRLFGSSIKHPQNVGFLSEKDKADVLNTSEYYLLANDAYLLEAIECGAKIMRPINGKLIEESIHYDNNIETYLQFLYRIL